MDKVLNDNLTKSSDGINTNQIIDGEAESWSLFDKKSPHSI